MIQQIGGFIGMMAADVAHFFRGRQAVPCLVEWDTNDALMGRINEAIANDPTFAWAEDDCCPDYGDCCVTTDTLGEYGK